MSFTIYSNYISYNIHSMKERFFPGDISRCLICTDHLSTFDLHPSRAMENISNEISSTTNDTDPSGYSRLFRCNKCHWWCIRESYQWFDRSILMYYGPDNLIAGVANDNTSVSDENMPLEETQPWLKAFNDPNVYDNLLNLPEELAALFKVKRVLKLRR